MGAGLDVWVKIRASEAERAEWHAKVEREHTRELARIGATLNQIARLNSLTERSQCSGAP